MAGFVYMLAMPLVAITATYVYFDRRVSDELAGTREVAMLPAELEIVFRP